MPHTHAPTKADACHEALVKFEEEHHHIPATKEKARLLSETITEWEHEQVAETHPSATA